MRPQTFLGTAVSAVAFLSSISVAQIIQSEPFNLRVTTSDGRYNCSGIQTCHVGAAIESLCLGFGEAVFVLNTTEGEISGVAGDGLPGTLTYVLEGGNFNESEAMSFAVQPNTNVALPIMQPSYLSQPVAFDGDDLMNVQSYLDDTTTPPTEGTATALYRWYVCQNNYNGYVYENLNWVLGSYPPQNPSCVKADVKRVFV